jgi:Zn-dependent protease
MGTPETPTAPATAIRPEPPGPEPRGVFGGRAFSFGRVAGIPLAVDHTWILIFLLVTLSIRGQLGLAHEGWSATATWTSALLTSLLFFASILLHELGHSLVAQRVGVKVRSITLFVFGGVAQLDSEATRPRDEVLIALAGPAVSVSLGLGFLGLAGLLGGGGEPGVAAESCLWLGRINLMVAAFNLVPGFPLDGGRVLRGVVWAFNGSFARATAVAGAAGSVFAYALIGLGIFVALAGRQLLSGLWLAFIGWFLLSAARATVGQTLMQGILAHVRVGDAADDVDEASVAGSVSVEALVSEAVLRHGLRTLYVVDSNGALQGLLTLKELAGVPAERRPYQTAAHAMVPLAKLETVSPDDDGWTALRRMAERNVNQLPVVDGRRLVGALTRERLLALVQAQLALGA